MRNVLYNENLYFTTEIIRKLDKNNDVIRKKSKSPQKNI